MPFPVGSAYGQIILDVSRVLDAVEKSAGALKRIEESARRVGQAITRAGDEMTRGLTLPLAGLGVAAGKAGMDFERSMQQIVGLVGVAQEQVDAWSKDLLEMGPALGRGPRELADALYFVTSSGIENSKAMSAVEASAKAASAGLGETQVIADAVTSAMNAYASSNLEAGKATGILVAAVREGKGEANEMAGSIGRVIPVAAQLGISFDQVAAAMAAQSLVGFDAAESATNLSSILSAFLKPSQQAADTLAQFGLSAEGVRQSLAEDGLLATLEMLRDTIGDDDEALAKVFPNVRAFRGLLSLIGENAETTRNIFAELAVTTEEDLNKAFEETQTSTFKFNQAMAGVQAALIDLGGTVLPAVLPTLEQLVAIVRDVVAWFKSLPEPVQQAAVQALALVAAVGPLLSIGGRLISGVGALAGLLGTLGGAFAQGARAAGTFAKTGVEVVQYLSEAGALTPALALKLGVLGAGLVVIAKYLEQVGRAASATNDELVKMSRSGDLFEQAAASTEVMANGSQRLRDVFVQHQDEMRAKLLAGEVTLEFYNQEIERTARLTGLWRDELQMNGTTIERVDEAVRQLTAAEVETARFLQVNINKTAEARDREFEMARSAEAAGDALAGMGDQAGDAAVDLEKLKAEQEKVEQRMKRLGTLMAGELGKELRSYRDRHAELTTESESLRVELERLEAQHGKVAAVSAKNAMSAEELEAAEAKLNHQTLKLADLRQRIDAEDDPLKRSKLVADYADLSLKADALASKMHLATGAQTTYIDNSKQIEEVKAKYGDLVTAIQTLKDEHREKTKNILFDLLQERLALDGLDKAEFAVLNQVAFNMGLVDQATYEATRRVDELVAAFEAGAIGEFELARAIETGVYPAMLRFGEETEKASERAGLLGESLVNEFVPGAATAIEYAGKFGDRLAQIPSEVVTRIKIETEGAIPQIPVAKGEPIAYRQAGGRLHPGVMTAINEMGLTQPEVVVAPRGGYVLTRQQAEEALRGQRQPREGDTYHVTINDSRAMQMWLDEQYRRKGERIEADL